MALATPILQQEHNIELKCRICALDFKIASEGVPIFSTDQLLEKIKNYLHIQVSTPTVFTADIKTTCI